MNIKIVLRFLFLFRIMVFMTTFFFSFFIGLNNIYIYIYIYIYRERERERECNVSLRELYKVVAKWLYKYHFSFILGLIDFYPLSYGGLLVYPPIKKKLEDKDYLVTPLKVADCAKWMIWHADDMVYTPVILKIFLIPPCNFFYEK